MESTYKLYDESAYRTHFDATIISVTTNKKTTDIVLNQTLFFPEEGGQECDWGTLNGMPVNHVSIKDDIITHTIKGHTNLVPGDHVEGQIDWQHRFDQMQNHSGEHLLSGIVHSQYGYDNIGFHLSQNEMTVDFNGLLSDEDLLHIEEAVNQAIYQNVAISCEYPAEEQLKDLDYRSKLELDHNVRIVTIEGYDVCACCAPHVHRTGDIGQLRIIRSMKHKQGIRLWLLAGERALHYAQKDSEQLKVIYRLLSANQASVAAHVQRLNDENNQLKKMLHDQAVQFLSAQIEEMDDNRSMYLFANDLSADIIKDAISRMQSRYDGYVGVLNGNDLKGYRYVIASTTIDCRTVSQLLKDNGGKGGGKKEMVQGYIHASKETLLDLLP